MKFAMAFLALSIVVAGCGRRDAALREKIPGTWVLTNGHGVITFAPDGSYFSRFTGSRTQAWAYEGKWQLKSNVIETSASKSHSVPLASECQLRIIRANGHELIYEVDGQTISLRRER